MFYLAIYNISLRNKNPTKGELINRRLQTAGYKKKDFLKQR